MASLHHCCVLASLGLAVPPALKLIGQGQGDDALALAALLLDDEEDLMHKASGWMLREVGQKVDFARLRGFLKNHRPEDAPHDAALRD